MAPGVLINVKRMVLNVIKPLKTMSCEWWPRWLVWPVRLCLCKHLDCCTHFCHWGTQVSWMPAIQNIKEAINTKITPTICQIWGFHGSQRVSNGWTYQIIKVFCSILQMKRLRSISEKRVNKQLVFFGIRGLKHGAQKGSGIKDEEADGKLDLLREIWYVAFSDYSQ